MLRRDKWFKRWGSFIAGLLLLGACSRPEETVIRIGAPLSLTGKLAPEGKLTKDGYDLAIEWINKKGVKVGGKVYRLDMRYYDDQSDANTAAKLTEKLITEDRVHFLLGPYASQPTFAASAVSERYRVIMVQANGAAEEIFTRGFKYMFGLLSPASFYCRDILKVAATLEPRPKTVALIGDTDLFSQAALKGAVEEAKRQGFQIVYHEAYPVGVTDISSPMTVIKAKNPDILIGAGHFNDTVLLVKTAKDLKVNPKILFSTVGVPQPEFVKVLKEDAENVIGFAQWLPTMRYQDPVFGSTERFVRVFKEKYGYEPDYHSAESAAAPIVLVAAIERAGSLETEKVREALATMELETLYAPVRFDGRGINVAKKNALLQIQGGRPVGVYPPEAAEAKLVYPKPPWR